MGITICPALAKCFLHYNPFIRIKIMCLGYNEDDENFTELVWEDDKSLDFYDRDSYPKFQLWYV